MPRKLKPTAEDIAQAKQAEFNFLNSLPEVLSPLKLMFLTYISLGVFDTKLHNGEFKTVNMYALHINDLINLGLVNYNGNHVLTTMGKHHMAALTKKELPK